MALDRGLVEDGEHQWLVTDALPFHASDDHTHLGKFLSCLRGRRIEVGSGVHAPRLYGKTEFGANVEGVMLAFLGGLEELHEGKRNVLWVHCCLVMRLFNSIITHEAVYWAQAGTRAMEVYTVDDVDIPYDELRDLRKRGKINLGIGSQDALALLLHSRGPTKTPVHLAAHLFTWLAIAVFVASVYSSFTVAWWLFIPGFVSMRVIWRATKKALPDNYLFAAMVDKEFYETGCLLGVWQYQMHPEDAAPFLTSS